MNINAVSSIQGTLGQAVKSRIKTAHSQYIIFYSNFFYTGTPGDENPDPAHDYGTLTVVVNGIMMINKQLARNTNYTSNPISCGEGDSVIVAIQASGHNMTNFCNYTFNPGTYISVDSNVAIGGNRVKRIITEDPVTNRQNIRRYYYGYLNSLNNSSATESSIRNPVYDKIYKVFVPCQPITNDPGDYITCNFLEYDYWSMYSNSQTNLQSSTNITYPSVIESFGENFENGGIEHHFETAPDQPGELITGDNMMDAPYCSYDYRNGKEIEQTLFRNNNGNLLPVRKIYTHYHEDDRIDSDYLAFIVNKKYIPRCTYDYLDDITKNAYDCIAIRYYRRWYYADTVKTFTYNQDGTDSLRETSVTIYANPAHTLPTSIISYTSSGIKKELNNYYPQDITLSGTEENARISLIAQHNIQTVLKQQEILNGNTDFIGKVSYNIFPNGLTLPQYNYLQIRNNSLEQRAVFSRYDIHGNIVEQQKTNDVKEVYLWGYNGQYPVAKIIGSEYDIVKGFVDTIKLNNAANYTDTDIRTELNKIRTGLKNTNAQVYTYTYAPLIGMTSEIDPKGNIIFYEYDGLGRLKDIKDKDGNIIKKSDYYYQLP